MVKLALAARTQPKLHSKNPRVRIVRGGSRASGFVKKLLTMGLFDRKDGTLGKISKDLEQNHSSYNTKWRDLKASKSPSARTLAANTPEKLAKKRARQAKARKAAK